MSEWKEKWTVLFSSINMRSLLDTHTNKEEKIEKQDNFVRSEILGWLSGKNKTKTKKT